MCRDLNEDLEKKEEDVGKYNERVDELKIMNEMIKEEILKLKGKSKEDSNMFKLGMMSLSTTYFN